MRLEHKQKRDDEFYNTLKKVISCSGERLTLIEAIRQTISKPASSFFLSERRIGDIIRAKETDVPKSSSKAELFSEIRKRYNKIKNDCPQMRSETIAKHIIAYESAPRFYISVSRGLSIYCNKLHERKRAKK